MSFLKLKNIDYKRKTDYETVEPCIYTIFILHHSSISDTYIMLEIISIFIINMAYYISIKIFLYKSKGIYHELVQRIML